jgi:hypothetical protein
MVSNIAVTEFTTSALFVFLIQRLKAWKAFTLLQAGKAWASRWASVFLAAVGAVGVSYTWTTYSGTPGVFSAWPGWYAIAIAGWHWLNHYAMQETIYQATANKVSLTTDAKGSVPMRVSPEGSVVVPQGGK